MIDACEISLTEAGILAGLDSSAARRHMMRGDFGPPRRGGKEWYVSRSAIDAFIEPAKRVGSPAAPVDADDKDCRVVKARPRFTADELRLLYFVLGRVNAQTDESAGVPQGTTDRIYEAVRKALKK